MYRFAGKLISVMRSATSPRAFGPRPEKSLTRRSSSTFSLRVIPVCHPFAARGVVLFGDQRLLRPPSSPSGGGGDTVSAANTDTSRAHRASAAHSGGGVRGMADD